MMLKDILHRLRKGTEINVYYINADGERKTIYTDLDGKPQSYVRCADVYNISVSDNGVLECEVEEP